MAALHSGVITIKHLGQMKRTHTQTHMLIHTHSHTRMLTNSIDSAPLPHQQVMLNFTVKAASSQVSRLAWQGILGGDNRV